MLTRADVENEGGFWVPCATCTRVASKETVNSARECFGWAAAVPSSLKVGDLLRILIAETGVHRRMHVAPSEERRAHGRQAQGALSHAARSSETESRLTARVGGGERSKNCGARRLACDV